MICSSTGREAWSMLLLLTLTARILNLIHLPLLKTFSSPMVATATNMVTITAFLALAFGLSFLALGFAVVLSFTFSIVFASSLASASSKGPSVAPPSFAFALLTFSFALVIDSVHLHRCRAILLVLNLKVLQDLSLGEAL